jgi:hypothetical protein
MAYMNSKDAGGSLMSDPFAGEDEYLPKLYLEEEQLAALGDIGDVGDTREIHCKVRVASISKGQDGSRATLEVIEMEFMEDDSEQGAAADRMYPTMRA